MNKDFKDLLKILQKSHTPVVTLATLWDNLYKFPFPLIPLCFFWDDEKQKVKKQPLVKWKRPEALQESNKWFKVILENFKKNRFYQGVAIVLDNLPVVVLDIDNVPLFSEKIQSVEKFLNDIKEVTPLIVKTLQKGYHVYFPRSLFEKIIPRLNNGELLKEYGFEIKHKELIIIPPSRFQYNGMLYQYEVLHIDPEKLDLPEEVFLKNSAFQKILEVLEIYKFEKEVEKLQKEYKAFTQGKEKERKDYKDLKETVEKVKKQISFKDLIPEYFHKSYSHYDTYHCPFHPPDRSPSFAVYRMPDGVEIAKDFHDGKTYDVISFWQEYRALDFIPALKDLCKIAGIDLEKKEKKEDSHTSSQESEKNKVNWKEAWESLEIQKVYVFCEDKKYVFEFVTTDVLGKTVSFKVPVSLMIQSAKKFLKKLLINFVDATGKVKLASFINGLKGLRVSKICQHIQEIAEVAPERGLDHHVFNEFIEIIQDSEWTDDWDTFYSSRTACKYIENGIIYLKLKGLIKRIERFANFKISEKEVIQFLRRLRAEPLRLTRNGRTLRVWKLPEGNWIQVLPANEENQMAVQTELPLTLQSTPTCEENEAQPENNSPAPVQSVSNNSPACEENSAQPENNNPACRESEDQQIQAGTQSAPQQIPAGINSERNWQENVYTIDEEEDPTEPDEKNNWSKEKLKEITEEIEEINEDSIPF